MRGSRGAAVSLVLAIVIWATSFPCIVLGLEALTAGDLVALRVGIASAALVILGRGRECLLPPVQGDLADVSTMVAANSCYLLLLTLGAERLNAGTTSVFVSTVPIIAALLATVTMREPLSGRVAAGLVLSSCGCIMLALVQRDLQAVTGGSLLVIAACIAQAIFIAKQRKLVLRYDPLTLTTYAMCGSLALLLPLAVGATGGIADPEALPILAAVYLGIGPTCIAYVLWARALQTYPVARAASSLNAVPVLALPLSWALLGEPLTPVTALAAGVVVSGVVLAQRRSHREERSALR